MISVLVPRAGGCPHRARAWGWVRQQLAEYEVIEGWGDASRWCKAEAVAEALSKATGDLLVLHDADVWSEHLADAITAVQSGKYEWAVPHWTVRRLTEHGTTQFIDGERETAEISEDHFAVQGGGIVVVTRDAYVRAPLDARFVSWGQEDKSFARALSTLAGKPFVIRQPLWHLYHPPQERMTRIVGNEVSKALWQRYVSASHQPRAMRALIEEGRQCRLSGSSRRA